MIDSDARYLYYVLPEGKAIRYGVTVGEDALSFSGVARVGRKEEWPSWTPTNDIKKRLGDIPAYVAPGPHNPMGSRALYVYSGNKDTLYRIHGTNQPEYIGSAISSGCIRLTNEDAIDLFNRVKINTVVVVLAPGQGDLPGNPRVAFYGRTRRLKHHPGWWGPGFRDNARLGIRSGGTKNAGRKPGVLLFGHDAHGGSGGQPQFRSLRTRAKLTPFAVDRRMGGAVGDTRQHASDDTVTAAQDAERIGRVLDSCRWRL